MKKAALFILILLVSSALWAQQNRHALVIGNANYTGSWNSLTNPVNDATDMEAALRSLGFQVELLRNANLNQMQTAVINFARRLSASRNSYGFFYYAGHGAQDRTNQNYLIPVDADTPSVNLFAQRALPVQFVLDELRDAGNELNMIVLDACRDLPPALSRSAPRGLSVIGIVPRGTIVMYATAAGSTASDGTGRNGLFTSHLLRNLTTPGLDVNEVFRRTGSDVARATNGEQYPETRYMYFETAYLDSRPSPVPDGLTTIIVGNDENDAVYWINGIRNVLPSTGNLAGATDIAISGSNVYIVGSESPFHDSGFYRDAVYWLNGVKNVLPRSSEDASASGIAISGSNVFIIGDDGDDAVYWLNGVRNVLPRSGDRASASSIAISGSNVFIIGKDGDDAVYWLNGIRNVLPKTGDYVRARGIVISGSNVFVIGEDGGNAIYWLNGIRNVLPKTGDYASARGIAISGSNVYITGFDGGNAVYWLNGVKHILPKKYNYGTAIGIAISGSNVYIVGFVGADDGSAGIGNDAVYWLNGAINILPTTGPMVRRVARKIIVIQ